MLIQTASREIMHHIGIRRDLLDQVILEMDKVHNTLAAEPLPVQTQGRIVGGNGGCGCGNLIKAIVLLGPEGGSISII